MPRDEDAVGGGVWETDDGRGTFVPGEAEGSDLVQGVWGGDGAWAAGGTHGNTAWEVSGGETALGSHGPRQGTADLQNRITDRRGTVEMSS